MPTLAFAQDRLRACRTICLERKGAIVNRADPEIMSTPPAGGRMNGGFPGQGASAPVTGRKPVVLSRLQPQVAPHPRAGVTGTGLLETLQQLRHHGGIRQPARSSSVAARASL